MKNRLARNKFQIPFQTLLLKFANKCVNSSWCVNETKRKGSPFSQLSCLKAKQTQPFLLKENHRSLGRGFHLNCHSTIWTCVLQRTYTEKVHLSSPLPNCQTEKNGHSFLVRCHEAPQINVMTGIRKLATSKQPS